MIHLKQNIEMRKRLEFMEQQIAALGRGRVIEMKKVYEDLPRTKREAQQLGTKRYLLLGFVVMGICLLVIPMKLVLLVRVNKEKRQEK